MEYVVYSAVIYQTHSASIGMYVYLTLTFTLPPTANVWRDISSSPKDSLARVSLLLSACASFACFFLFPVWWPSIVFHIYMDLIRMTYLFSVVDLKHLKRLNCFRINISIRDLFGYMHYALWRKSKVIVDYHNYMSMYSYISHTNVSMYFFRILLCCWWSSLLHVRWRYVFIPRIMYLRHGQR